MFYFVSIAGKIKPLIKAEKKARRQHSSNITDEKKLRKKGEKGSLHVTRGCEPHMTE